MCTLDRTEIALLHLLKAQDKPVDVAFFSRLDPSKNGRSIYGSFTQRFQGVFTRVKDRLVRRGILLLALGPESLSKKTKMERWQIALPVQFGRHLPPLIECAKRLSGVVDWRRDLAREKLKTAVVQGANSETKNDRVEIVKGELRWGGQTFRADRVVEWQKLHWQAETDPATLQKAGDPHTLPAAGAVLRILGGLDADLWSDADTLAVPLEVFCGSAATPLRGRGVCAEAPEDCISVVGLSEGLPRP